jgi:outer membrane protein assembly factor BamB
VALSAGLLLTACGGGQDRAATEEADAPQGAVTVNNPLVTTYDGGLYVLDGDTLEVVRDIELEGFNRINPAGDDRHLFVSTSEGFQLLDAVAGELTGDLVAAEEPGHVVRHAGRTVLFADGSGEVTLLDSDSLGDGLPEDPERYTTEEAHHGVAVELGNGELLVTLGDEEERVGAAVLDADREEVARSEECPGVHGETVAADETIVIGCEDGILTYRDGEFTKVESPDDYGRIGNQAGSEESPVVLGDYKTDPDAELERPERVALVDAAEADLTLVDLPSSYTFRSLGRGPDGEALVLGTDGVLHVIDPETAEIVDGIEVTDEWEEPLEWQDPRPALFVRDTTAYVSDPATDQIHAVDLETGEVTASVTLDGTPNELSGVAH